MRGLSSEQRGLGRFGYLCRSADATQLKLFDPTSEQIRLDLLSALASGPQHVSLFVKEWALRPGDLLVGQEYKQILLALEEEGKIVVVKPETGEVVTASRRPKHGGKVTLGEKWAVRRTTE